MTHKKDVIIIMGDFNAKVGNITTSNIIEKYGMVT